MDGQFGTDMLKAFEDYAKKIEAAGRSIDPAAKKAVEAGGEIVFKDMLDHVAVDTGALKAHLTETGKTDVYYEGNMPTIEIGLLDLGAVRGGYGTFGRKATRKKQYGRVFLYGVILEYGKSNMAAQPYIRPAFDNNKSRVRQAEVASLKASGVFL